MGLQLRYSVNKNIRRAATKLMSGFPEISQASQFDIGKEKIDKILLVRANFRMGNSILAIPGIDLFRKNFPNATIDFVGSPASKALFQNLPIDHHYRVTRGFLESCWSYPALIGKLRSVRYDLAVELSCSQSALGAFIVGLSGARRRVGRKGKWDSWYNVKIDKPVEYNKYRVLPMFLASMGLETEEIYPRLVLSSVEKRKGQETIDAAATRQGRPVVGVFVGGRERLKKRWPAEAFLQLIFKLRSRDLETVVFIGPEEKRLAGFFKQHLAGDIPLVCEPSLRKFAAIVANCGLFVTSDSGPLHLACAVGVRTVALFQKRNFDRWAPPASLARVVFEPNALSVERVEAACLEELDQLCALQSKAGELG